MTAINQPSTARKNLTPKGRLSPVARSSESRAVADGASISCSRLSRRVHRMPGARGCICFEGRRSPAVLFLTALLPADVPRHNRHSTCATVSPLISSLVIRPAPFCEPSLTRVRGALLPVIGTGFCWAIARPTARALNSRVSILRAIRYKTQPDRRDSIPCGSFDPRK